MAGSWLVVAGVALWSVAAALVCAGVMVMAGAVALAAVQEVAASRPSVPDPATDGTAPNPQEAVR